MKTRNAGAFFVHFALALFGFLTAGASRILAIPVTYTLVVQGVPGAVPNSPAGTLGPVAFGVGSAIPNAILTFTFEGDTANVLHFTAPTFGYEILLGTATVTLTNGDTRVVVAQGTFLPSAGIFVSVDDSGGIGFGSFGLPPSDPNFGVTIHPVYPYALFDTSIFPYDLKSNFIVTEPSTAGPGAYTCYDFPPQFPPNPCGMAVPLPTTAGNLLIPFPPYFEAGTFTTVLHPVSEFTSFVAEADIRKSGYFFVRGSFTLGSGTYGINPLSDTVTLQIGSDAIVLPPGSFKRRDGAYVFQGTIGSAIVTMHIERRSTDTYEFSAHGTGANPADTTNPLAIVLTIGGDSGTTTARTVHDD